MTTLAQAPLIEAIFELRWGGYQIENGITQFQFSQDDTTFFVGQFNAVANNKDYKHIENLNAGIGGSVPHLISHRFRKSPNSWPCLQIGLGIFTVNQLNEGYDWKSYKQNILQGLQILDEGHPKGLEGLEGLGVELRYIDGFPFAKDEKPEDFIKNKLNITFGSPEEFLKSDILDKDNCETGSFTFTVKLHKPAGRMIVEVKRMQINGIEGYVMETSVRSHDDTKPKFNFKELDTWLEEAHSAQRHAFETMINPTFAKTFK